MKILVISDTHKKHRNFESVLRKLGAIDMLLHLGDTEGGEDYIEALAGCPVHIVGGNNDFFSMLPREEEFFIGAYKVFMTHGHNYYVSMGESRIQEEARSRNADIVMYGHTHRPSLKIEDDLVTLNPGSLSYPRQEGRAPSFIIMELDKDEEMHYTICYL